MSERLGHLGEDRAFGHDAEDERVLAVGEAVGPVRRLPVGVLLHQIDVVQCVVVELGVRDQSRAGGVVGSV